MTNATMPTVPVRRLPAALGVIGLVAFALLSGWSAAPAAAHNYLVSSSPEDGAVVTEQPGLISVTTNDALLDLDGTGAGSAIQVSGPSDAPLYYGDGCVSVAGATAETTAELGQAGEYTVTWQVVSTDGHPISDTLTFDWQPAAGQALAEGAATVPDCGATSDSDSAADTGASATDSDATDSGDTGSAADAGLGDAAWILAALGTVGIVVTVTVLVLRRRA
ncbi:copper resistance protein CopC [Cryobacterium melibiosiphilum]|uniref:Copper resistance protein CopC n=1 Tax=Cryobacterium melibiosiphilum TaxID=995039 RepID=A0A3A5MKT0_9MICO|nr:copper resistance CopC family protein [Cryobacterium melibiosiphilum]RJT89571.1 copper resistance protein CopC [Cryobacterium melibiosiphilum]